MIRHSNVLRALGSLATSCIIGVIIGLTPCAVAQNGELQLTPGPFSAEWVEIVHVSMTMSPNEVGILSISLRNRTHHSLWATIVVRTPDPTQDCEITGELEAGRAEIFTCSQRVLFPKKDYRLVVQIYKNDGARTLQGSLQTTFRFRKSDADSSDAQVSSVEPYLPTVSPVDSARCLSEGDRVRMYTSTTAGRITGRITALDDTTVTVAVASGRGKNRMVLHRRDITGMEIRWGGRPRSTNILIGTALGAGVGALVGLASGDDDPSVFLALKAEEKALIFAVPLALVGALIGLALPAEDWQPAPQDCIGVSVWPVPGRAGLSLTYSF